MDEMKERIINNVDLLKENHDLLQRVMTRMRIRKQVYIPRNGGHIDRNGN